MKQHNMNIPRNDRKIIRKTMIIRIEISPKEAHPGVEKPPPPPEKIEGPGPSEQTVRAEACPPYL